VTIVNFNPQESPRNAAQAKSITLGEKYWVGTRAYRFVKAVDAVDITAGMVVEYAAATFNFEVSADNDGSSITVAAGVAMVAVDVSTDYVYFWIQTDGPNLVAMLSDNSVAAGKLVASAGGDGTVKLGPADGTLLPQHVGIASADDGGTAPAIGTIFLQCP
jgi:hypothetical protein